MSRKVSYNVVNAFVDRRAATFSNSHSDGTTLYLFGNPIAKWVGGDLQICPVHYYSNNRGYFCGMSSTTRERLNTLLGAVGSSYRVANVKFEATLYKDGADQHTFENGDWVWVTGVNHGIPTHDPSCTQYDPTCTQ